MGRAGARRSGLGESYTFLEELPLPLLDGALHLCVLLRSRSSCGPAFPAKLSTLHSPLLLLQRFSHAYNLSSSKVRTDYDASFPHKLTPANVRSVTQKPHHLTSHPLPLPVLQPRLLIRRHHRDVCQLPLP